MLLKPLCHTRTGKPTGRPSEPIAGDSAIGSAVASKPFEATAHDLRNLGE